jgi:signal transduction histidine kinase
MGGATGVSDDRTLEEKLGDVIWELSVLNEISSILLSTMELDEILHIILTGVTAGEGFGFNRAFLFLVDDEAGVLEGKIAMGPSDREEAGRIWSALGVRKAPLREILKSYQSATGRKDVRVNEIVSSLKIPLADKDHLLIRALSEKRSFNVTKDSVDSPALSELEKVLGTDSFAVVPLVSRDEAIGVLLADNMINGRPIEDEDVEVLQTFANHASSAIENSRLYKKLSDKVAELEEANRALKENQDKLVRSERLSAVGEAAARIAHEIRNPLVAIGGFARSILKRLPEGDPNRKYSSIISSEVVRLEKMLSQTLDFVRPREPQFKRADLNGLIRGTLSVMENEIAKAKVSVKSNLSVGLPEVMMDEDQMREVLLNILRNALHAMPGGGELKVSTRRDEALVLIDIADTGVGIPQDNMKRLFEAFFTTKPDGTGLGLTISSKIIQSHNGSIGVKSLEGTGSVFTISLPIEQP